LIPEISSTNDPSTGKELSSDDIVTDWIDKLTNADLCMDLTESRITIRFNPNNNNEDFSIRHLSESESNVISPSEL
jgi:hypothetical protein